MGTSTCNIRVKPWHPKIRPLRSLRTHQQTTMAILRTKVSTRELSQPLQPCTILRDMWETDNIKSRTIPQEVSTKYAEIDGGEIARAWPVNVDLCSGSMHRPRVRHNIIMTDPRSLRAYVRKGQESRITTIRLPSRRRKREETSQAENSLLSWPFLKTCLWYSSQY